MAKDNPYLFLVPQPLPGSTPTTARAFTLSDFGYEFALPWQGPTTTRKSEAMVAYIFAGERSLLFWNPVRHGVGTSATPAQAEFMQTLFGYNVLRSSLYVTPDQVKLMLWTRELARRWLLLNFKNIELDKFKTVSAVYSFEGTRVRGFQIGNPASDALVEILCFDSDGHRLEFEVSHKLGSDSPPTQQDINLLIATLRPADSQGAASPTPPR